ncbi:sensor histidine kinase [Parasphingorhabdus pacifica]
MRVLGTDVALAIVLGTAILLITPFAARGEVPPHTAPDWISTTLIVIAAASLVPRRFWPLVTLAGSVGSLAVYLALQYPPGPVFLTGVVAIYSVACMLPMGRSALAAASAVLVLTLGHLSGMTWEAFVTDALSMLLGGGALMVAPWAVGTVVRLHRESESRLREDEARKRAYDERLRVVQEVHDVVGHGLSAINLQSGVALHVLDQQPEQARPALTAIRQTSKDALDELRGTLAVFRQPEEPGERVPTPGLANLDALVERMDRAGLPIEAVVDGEPRSLPATVDLAAYRIVQESLTNVVRHAGPSSASVRVEYRDDGVDVEITDNGKARMSVDPASEGQGIAGMRERARAVGGNLHAGPRPGGGFRVHAHLPLEGAG